MSDTKPMAEWIYENVERDLDKNVTMIPIQSLKASSSNAS